MYDGIVFGDTLFSGGTTDRQFVLLSDGGDTASVATLEDALAVTSRVRTNAIEIVTSESNSEAIAGLAQAGSGRLTSVADPTGLGVLYQEVARSLVNRYRVGFTSQSSGETTYNVEIATPFGPVSGSTVVTVPDAPTPETTPATTPPVTQSAPLQQRPTSRRPWSRPSSSRPRWSLRPAEARAARSFLSYSASPPWVSDSRRCWSSCSPATIVVRGAVSSASRSPRPRTAPRPRPSGNGSRHLPTMPSTGRVLAAASPGHSTSPTSRCARASSWWSRSRLRPVSQPCSCCSADRSWASSAS